MSEWESFKEVVKKARKTGYTMNGWRVNSEIILNQGNFFFSINPFCVNLSKGSYPVFEYCMRTGKRQLVKNIRDYMNEQQTSVVKSEEEKP